MKHAMHCNKAVTRRAYWVCRRHHFRHNFRLTKKVLSVNIGAFSSKSIFVFRRSRRIWHALVGWHSCFSGGKLSGSEADPLRRRTARNGVPVSTSAGEPQWLSGSDCGAPRSGYWTGQQSNAPLPTLTADIPALRIIQGGRSWRVRGSDPLKICRRGRSMFWPPKSIYVTFFHSELLLDNAASSKSWRMKDFCQKWKVKLIFRGAWYSLIDWLIFIKVHVTNVHAQTVMTRWQNNILKHTHKLARQLKAVKWI